MAIVKPTIGGDADNWGTILNADLDEISTRLTTLESAPSGGLTSVASTDITDATAVGRAVLTAVDASAVRTATGAAAATTTVNGHALNANVSLVAADVSAVPNTRVVNGKPLSADVTLAATDVGAVPTTRTVNGKELSANVTLVATDIITTPLDLTTAPAGMTVTVAKSGSVWPARPTARTDIIVQWKGPDPSPAIVESGTGGMLDNVDIRLITTS